MALFSARLDETGTDGRSKFTLVGGAVAPPEGWDALEAGWGALLKKSGVTAYHWKEFHDPQNGTFGPWSKMKRERFVTAQEKIIGKCTSFRVAVGVDQAVHADVKRRMKGIKGFRPDSDYSLCLRWLMFWTCEELAKVDPDCRLSIMVEDGPWASGAMDTYQRIAAMTGKRKPAKHAHRLAGFGSAPKGERLSLEAADYIAGCSLGRLIAGRERKSRDTLAVMLKKPLLDQWYEGMIAEKEARREFARKRKATSSEQSS
ncbi:MAG TPA: hypothetical protein DHW63_12825 [Hyphomonadaceae bacterium]|nr:hypothetical protein [Hyphomonadaceae bacterium]